MGRGRNKFARAIKHIKSTQIDERLELLNEIPTNSTTGYMTAVPGGVGGVEWTDKTYTTDTGGNTIFVDSVDFDADADEYGQDTSGLFDTNGSHPAGTRVRTIEPPGDTSYVLGPMTAMFYTWSRPWTQIGYIRESDRRMIDLGRLEGKLSDWDGNADDLNSYGQLTLEQALWFRDVKKKDNAGNDPDNYNYRAFYPGPPSNAADGKGRYLCCIVGESKRIIGSQTRKGPSVPNISATGGDASTDLSAMLDRLVNSAATRRAKATGKNLWDIVSGQYSNTALKGALNILRGFTDKAMFGSGDYIFKGLEKGVDYLPSFTGASNLKLFGKKIPKIADWNPLLKRLAGKNYASQYFTPDLDTALKYAGEGGTVTAIPRTKGVRGIKNWLGSNISRGFDPTKGVEQLVRTSDTIALKNLTKTFDIADPASKEALEALAKKGVKNAGVLGRLGKFVPFLNAGLVVADVTSRLSKQPPDYAGALLGGFQAIPGPVGWIAMGAQLTYDVGGGYDTMNNFYGPKINALKKNLSSKGPMKGSRSRFGEEYISEQNESALPPKEDMRQALIEMGLPMNKEDYIAEMGTYLTLLGVNPQLLSILLLSIGGKELSKDQKKWVDDNFVQIISGISKLDFSNKDLSPDNPLSSEDDPWALDKQQTQESRNLVESRRRVIKNLKKPVVIPEDPKVIKVRPRVIGHPSTRQLCNQMKDVKENQQFKRPLPVWSMNQMERNTLQSQEKKNEGLMYLGYSADHWEVMTGGIKEHNDKMMNLHYGDKKQKKKVIRKENVNGGDYAVIMEDEKGYKSSILQSDLNDKLAEKHHQEDLDLYNKMYPKKKSVFREIVERRKKGQFDYEGKPSPDGHPEQPPAKMVKGWHPNYGKKHNMFNRIDPQTANAMPETGDPEIDAKVKKAKMQVK